MIDYELNDQERQKILNDFETGKIQVIINVAILIEGWDCPIVSCVLLLRPNSCPSTLQQMIGRGLRIVDPNIHPNIIKENCVVIDFGNSIKKHLKNIFETKKDLNPQKNKRPLFCDKYQYESIERGNTNKKIIIKEDNFLLKEIPLPPFDQEKNTSFRWINFDENIMASGFNSFAVIKQIKDIWYSFGGLQPKIKKKKTTYKEKCIKILNIGSKINCFASANDWLNENEDNNTNYIKMNWTNEPGTEKQLKFIIEKIEKEKFLSKLNVDELKKSNKYKMSVLISYLINKKDIEKAIKKLQNYQKQVLSFNF